MSKKRGLIAPGDILSTDLTLFFRIASAFSTSLHCPYICDVNVRIVRSCARFARYCVG
jgi:hypothetical protein